VAYDESRPSAGRPKWRQLNAVSARGTDGEHSIQNPGRGVSKAISSMFLAASFISQSPNMVDNFQS